MQVFIKIVSGFSGVESCIEMLDIGVKTFKKSYKPLNLSSLKRSLPLPTAKSFWGLEP